MRFRLPVYDGDGPQAGAREDIGSGWMEMTDAEIERWRSSLVNDARREALSRTLAAARAEAATSRPQLQVEPFGLMRLPDGVMVVYRRRAGGAQVFASPTTEPPSRSPVWEYFE
jgi:hypothetical protein